MGYSCDCEAEYLLKSVLCLSTRMNIIIQTEPEGR